MPTARRKAERPTTDTQQTDAATKERAAEAGDEAIATAGEVADSAAPTGRGLIGSVGQIVTLPATVVRDLADDVASVARRPDAAAYVGGVVALAALGVLEWPVAAVAGVGVAVANGVRRRRS